MTARHISAETMSVQENIERKIAEGLEVLHLEVINESSQHNVPPGSESHFKVVVVSNDFLEKNLLAQHRMVYKLLGSELQNQVHALALHTYTEQGWRESQGTTPMSPPCLGGKSRESV
jgi:BolA protein